jgi:hypothetical protein
MRVHDYEILSVISTGAIFLANYKTKKVVKTNPEKCLQAIGMPFTRANILNSMVRAKFVINYDATFGWLQDGQFNIYYPTAPYLRRVLTDGEIDEVYKNLLAQNDSNLLGEMGYRRHDYPWDKDSSDGLYDNVRIAYEWLDAQKITKSPNTWAPKTLYRGFGVVGTQLKRLQSSLPCYTLALRENKGLRL